MWKRIEISTDDGPAAAVEPLILSASRSTDIPAFYADWFMHRLEKGWLKWINPFNNTPMVIALSNVKACVFWTKNPKPMMPFLSELDRRNIAYYFQFTVNDYDADDLEPNVPPLADRLETFRRLSDQLGPDRVIWRFDPLILTDRIDADTLIEKVQRVGAEIHACTRKLVFSFADIAEYAKVQRNLARAGIRWQSWDDTAIKQVAARLSDLCRGWSIQAATCAETVSLESFGIQHNQCIDPALLAELTNDPDLLQFLGYRKGMFGLEPAGKTRKLKDAGQRLACGCIVSKDIGQYNTCPHLCRYCYANTSENVVMRNRRHLQGDSETIIHNT